MGHLISGSWGKKTVKRYLKSEHTDKRTDTRTDRQTDRWTFRLIESIGPEGRCFENIQRFSLKPKTKKKEVSNLD